MGGKRKSRRARGASFRMGDLFHGNHVLTVAVKVKEEIFKSRTMN